MKAQLLIALVIWLSISFTAKVRAESDFLFYNIVKQQMDISCGPATIATLLKYWLREDVSEQNVIQFIERNATPQELNIFNEYGASDVQLAQYAKHKGYTLSEYNKQPEALYEEFKRPVIVHLYNESPQHWTIYKGISADTVYLADTNLGNISLSKAEFEEKWINPNLGNRGVILDLDTGHDFNFNSFLYQPSLLNRLEHASPKQRNRATQYTSAHMNIADAESLYNFNSQPAYIQIKYGENISELAISNDDVLRDSYNTLKLTYKKSALREFYLEAVSPLKQFNSSTGETFLENENDITSLSISTNHVFEFVPHGVASSIARSNYGVDKNIETGKYGVSFEIEFIENWNEGYYLLGAGYSRLSDLDYDGNLYFFGSRMKSISGFEISLSGQFESKGISDRLLIDIGETVEGENLATETLISGSINISKDIYSRLNIATYFKYERTHGKIKNVNTLYRNDEKSYGMSARINAFENSNINITYRNSLQTDIKQLGVVISYDFVF